MQSFLNLRSHLSTLASDNEVGFAFAEFFSSLGTVNSADRFFGLGEPNRRYFLIQFKDSADAMKATSKYKLRSFGFNGVLIELN